MAHKVAAPEVEALPLRNSTLDLASMSVREVNQLLHHADGGDFRIENPRGLHAIAAGLDGNFHITVDGHVGYYCAGMNKRATVIVNGNAGTGVAENMMSGRVHVKGDVSQSAAPRAAAAFDRRWQRIGALRHLAQGLDIVVKGSVGHMSAFMAQAGTLVVLGDAGDALGDSIYEARLYLRGQASSLGADCVLKDMRDAHKAALRNLLDAAGVGAEIDVSDFRRYGSARKLYNFHIDNLGSY
jgi:glutamate synthase domain-containing protein 3